jgi:hypothetical protein
MKKTLLMTCTLLALGVGIAAAGPGGVNLGWLDCGGLAASQNRTFTCTTNTGIHTLVGSFVAPSGIEQCSANEVVIDIQSAGVALPAWWSLRGSAPLGCRSSSMTQSGDFTGGPFNCFDYWQGGASGGVSQDTPVGNRARIKMLEGLPAGNPNITSIPEGTEVYSFKLNIGSQKTVGLGACAGCIESVCIVLNSIAINQPPPLTTQKVSAPAPRNWATWQNGIPGDCLAATPAKNSTWGSVKALYR